MAFNRVSVQIFPRKPEKHKITVYSNASLTCNFYYHSFQFSALVVRDSFKALPLNTNSYLNRKTESTEKKLKLKSLLRIYFVCGIKIKIQEKKIIMMIALQIVTVVEDHKGNFIFFPKLIFCSIMREIFGWVISFANGN